MRLKKKEFGVRKENGLGIKVGWNGHVIGPGFENENFVNGPKLNWKFKMG